MGLLELQLELCCIAVAAIWLNSVNDFGKRPSALKMGTTSDTIEPELNVSFLQSYHELNVSNKIHICFVPDKLT